MDEDELERLREQKRQEIEESESQEDDRRSQIKDMAAKYLTSEARSRLGNVRAADPELAEQIETQVARLGEMGRIDKMGDSELKDILKSLQKEKQDNDTDIKFRR
jgi:programmed cell death protein 5